MSWNTSRIADVSALFGGVWMQPNPLGDEWPQISVPLVGLHLNIDPALMKPDLAPFVVTPAQPIHDFGDCVRLVFPGGEAQARATSLGALWAEVVDGGNG